MPTDTPQGFDPRVPTSSGQTRRRGSALALVGGGATVTITVNVGTSRGTVRRLLVARAANTLGGYVLVESPTGNPDKILFNLAAGSFTVPAGTISGTGSFSSQVPAIPIPFGNKDSPQTTNLYLVAIETQGQAGNWGVTIDVDAE